jgi:hypothetical protein
VLRKAAEDVRYLVNRGYPKESAIRFVSDHHRLPEEQRFVLSRVVVAAETAQLRRIKAVPAEALHGQEILVDGYNVLITVESLIGGRPVYMCDDGFLRDTQGIFRSYRTSDLTVSAIQEILIFIARPSPASILILLDQQISMSGRLAGLMREMMAKIRLPGTAKTARDVDRQLKSSRAIVATADGNVIDAAARVIDLPWEIARRRGSPVEVL